MMCPVVRLPRPPRLPWLVAGAVAVLLAVLLAALIGVALLRGGVPPIPGVTPDECRVTVDDTTVTLSPEQGERAGVVAGLAVGRGLPARAATVALTVGLRDSDLDRLPEGGRDGVRALLDRIAAVPDYRRLEVAEAAAAAAGGEAADYEDHVEDARVLASALTGNSEEAFSCRLAGEPGEASDELGPAGLVPRADAVRADIVEVFGRLPLGGFEPRGVSTGHMEGSAHYEGRAVDAFFRPVNPANQVRGWALAQYLVSQADRLAIKTVIFDDRIWTNGIRSSQGWRDYDPPARSGDTAILEHRDHVHVDVFD